MEKSKRKKPCDWLPDQGWEDIVRLTELFPNEFGSLISDIEKNLTEWKDVRLILIAHTQACLSLMLVTWQSIYFPSDLLVV